MGKQLTQAERDAIKNEIANTPDLTIDNTTTKDGPPDAELEQRFPELAQMKADLQAQRRGGTKTKANSIMATWDVSKTPSPTYILQRGNYLAPGEAVEPGLPAVLDDPQQPFRFPDPKAHPEWNHTGRRLTLAQCSWTRPAAGQATRPADCRNARRLAGRQARHTDPRRQSSH